VEDELAAGRRRVDALLQRAEPDAGVFELRDGLDELLERAPEPVEPPDDQRIARAEIVQRGRQPPAVGTGTADRVGEDPLALDVAQGDGRIKGALPPAP
jgi:hypothetical protein